MLKELLQNNASKEEILAFLEDKHAYDIVQLLDELDSDEKAVVFDLLDAERKAEILSYLEPEDAADVIVDLEPEEQAEIVSELNPDDAADIINELPEEERQELIEKLDKDEEVLELLDYEEFKAGSYMTNLYMYVDLDTDVKKATKKLIKEAKEVESIQTIFVVDNEHKYQGQITLKALIKAKYPLSVNDIMEVQPTFKVDSDVDELIKHMKHYGGYDVGIVDDNDVLVGMITMDDLLDIYQDEAIEDFEKFTALPDTDFDQNVFKSSFKRLPWLVILLILSIPLAFVTSNFEEMLASVVVLALFQPLILDSGGDVASQTLAVTLISLTNKDSNPISNGIKEILSGTISGLVMGILAFLVTFIFGFTLGVSSPVLVALVVGLALWITVILAPTLGFLIPTVLYKLKFDPAVASGPFITTLIDILSIFIYFGLATLMLGGVIHA
jgi:magnesium transporter